MTRFLGFGTALPEFEITPEAGRLALGRLWPHLTRAKVEPVTRFTVRPLADVLRPSSLAERMRTYAREAPRLARLAAERALQAAGVEPAEVDAVISVSCTGYMVPSLDVRLANEMDLRRDLVRIPLTELGCSGGGAAIGMAHRYLRAAPQAVVLVICVELCSLTFSSADSSLDNLTASLVFGDGAAAAVLADRRGGLQVTRVGSWLAANTEDVLGFALAETGFHPILDRSLPRLLARELPVALAAFGAGPGGFQAVHAGGPRIFDAVEAALGLGHGGLEVSREVFRRCGNISSASLLFVLAAMPEVEGEGLALAFGPGISFEMAALRRFPE